jgi:hypothetical protein
VSFNCITNFLTQTLPDYRFSSNHDNRWWLPQIITLWLNPNTLQFQEIVLLFDIMHATIRIINLSNSTTKLKAFSSIYTIITILKPILLFQSLHLDGKFLILLSDLQLWNMLQYHWIYRCQRSIDYFRH